MLLGLTVVGVMLSEVIAYALQVRCGGGRPADPHVQERNICSKRAIIYSSSMNSPQSACAMPSRTAPRNRASSSSRRKAASFTKRGATWWPSAPIALPARQ
jgi:hypothetical protein